MVGDPAFVPPTDAPDATGPSYREETAAAKRARTTAPATTLQNISAMMPLGATGASALIGRDQHLGPVPHELSVDPYALRVFAGAAAAGRSREPLRASPLMG